MNALIHTFKHIGNISSPNVAFCLQQLAKLKKKMAGDIGY